MKIDSGIPLPTTHNANRKYPFFEMKIGDSFFVPLPTAVRAAVSWCTKLHPDFCFCCRSVTENGAKGIRVWRIEPKEKPT